MAKKNPIIFDVQTLSYKNNILYIRFDDINYYGTNPDLHFNAKEQDIDILYDRFKDYVNNLLKFNMLYKNKIKLQVDNVYIVEADITEAKQDIVILPVDGSGKLDKKYKDKYRMNYREYNQLCVSSHITQLYGGKTMYCNKDREWQTIANIFVIKEYDFKSGTYIDYKALELCLTDIKEFYREQSLQGDIAIPMLTQDQLGGSDWDIVFDTVKQVFKDTDIAVFIYDENYEESEGN